MTHHVRSAFHDLENDPKVAENLRLRALLMMRLSAWMNEQQLSQREAAATLGVSQPRVSDLVRGQIDKFSLDALVEMVARTGARVELAIK